MFTITQKDLLDAMANGTSAEDLAKNFTEALNNAVATRNAEAEKKVKLQKKKDCMNSILDVIDKFIEEFYPEVYDKEIMRKLDAETVISMFDEAYNETLRMTRLLGKAPVPVQSKVDKRSSANDPIAEFLKKYNL